MNKKAIYFDIDGTLANIDHRLHFIQSDPKSWNDFYESMNYDLPYDDMIDLAFDFMDQNYELVYCTGRPSTYRYQTECWLNRCGLPSYNLYMRQEKDYRPDWEIKKELLQQIEQDGFRILYAFEDRDQVVNMLRDNNIRTFQVKNGQY